jgi:sugar lactone lactonase YvrE
MRALALLAVPAALAAGAALPVRATSLPRTAVAGTPWQAVLRAPAAPTVVARGPSLLRRKATGRNGVFRASLTFPRAGTWQISATVRGRATPLGSVSVDAARDAAIVDPISIAVDESGSILVAQLRERPLLRLADGHATVIGDGPGFFQLTVTGASAYAAARDGSIYRLTGATLERVGPSLDADAVVADAGGNLYVAIYAGYVKRIARDGTVTTLAGDGTEGYAGDGGPASAAKLFHPHALVLGRDGALYVADTENRRIRRIDLSSGRITTFGGDVGVTVSLAAAPDGSIYSADVVRDGTGGGVTRTSPSGATTRVIVHPSVNGVAVAPDGTVYVNRWEEKRIDRLVGRRLEPVARG